MSHQFEKITVTLDPEILVLITNDYSGYSGGRCLVCGKSGWLVSTRLGIAHSDPSRENALRHKRTCEVGLFLEGREEKR